MSEGIRDRELHAPGPLDAEGAAREARLRVKLARGEPLSFDERQFLATLPAGRAISPEEIQAAAAKKGGVAPIDALTGKPHVAKPPGESEDRNLVPPHDGRRAA